MNKPLSLHVTRIIKAERGKVFAAWTKPELIALWFAPSPMQVAAADADPRPGGSYFITMKGNDQEVTVAGRYEEVIENERLIFTWGWKGDPSPQTLVTVEFLEAPEGTKLSLRHERFAAQEAVLKHEQGWTGCLASLEKHFA